LKNQRPPNVRPATKSVATVVSRAATVTVAAMKNASLVKNVHRVKNAHHVSHVKLVKKRRLLLAKNAHLVKSAHHAPLVKNVPRALHAKIASHEATAKSVRFVNCVSLWMPLQLSLPPSRLLPLPLKSVQLASHVKNALHAHRVKNVSHVPSKRLPLPKKNW
jgi:hypothetical protein